MKQISKIYLIKVNAGYDFKEESHFRGPNKSQNDVKRRIRYYQKGYYYPITPVDDAKYHIVEAEVEPIPESRFIQKKTRAVNYIHLIPVRYDGSVPDNDSEYFNSNYFFD